MKILFIIIIGFLLQGCASNPPSNVDYKFNNLIEKGYDKTNEINDNNHTEALYYCKSLNDIGYDARIVEAQKNNKTRIWVEVRENNKIYWINPISNHNEVHIFTSHKTINTYTLKYF